MLLVPAAPAFADTTFETSDPLNNYPNSIVFQANIESDQEITDVTFRFSLKNRDQSGFGKPDSLTPGTSVTAAVEIETNPDTNWLPVGNEFTYHWEATLADGSVVESPEEIFLFLPPNRDWVSVTNGLLTVHYYGERTNTANSFLDAAEEVYADIGQGLFDSELEHLPVKVVLFVSTDEIAESQPSKGSTVEASGLVTCGFRPGSADDIIVVAARCGGGSSVDTLRHEFGHILNANAGESSLVTLPSWIDEGLSVYAQDENGFAGAFQSGLRREELLPFNRLNLPPSDPNDTLLFYGQSYAMVSYLIDVFGEDKLAELMSLTSNGTRFDRAFEQIYGMDMLGFEEVFREANGLPPANQSADPTPEPTTANEQPSGSTSTPDTDTGFVTNGSDNDGYDLFVVGSISAAVLFALVAIFLLLLTQVLSNRRTATVGVGGNSTDDGPSPPSEPGNGPPGEDGGEPPSGAGGGEPQSGTGSAGGPGRGRDQSRWGRPD